MNTCPICNNEFDTSKAAYRDGMLVCNDCVMAEKQNRNEEVDELLDEPFRDTSLTKREVIAFIGDNEAYYLKKWGNGSADKVSLKAINWAALFFPIYWLVYRRMYRNVAFYFAIVIAAELALGFLGLKLEHGVAMASKVVIGIYGNTLYYKHMIRKTNELKYLKPNNLVELSEISSSGGTRAKGVWIVIFIEIVLIILAVIAFSL